MRRAFLSPAAWGAEAPVGGQSRVPSQQVERAGDLTRQKFAVCR